MKFEQVCQPLNAYFAQHPVFRVLLPVSMPAMIICAAIHLVSGFISIGSVASALVLVLFCLFLILTVSTCSFRMSAVGLSVYAAYYIISWLKNLIRFHSLSWVSLIYLAVYGGLAFLAYRKSIDFNK